MDNRSVLTGIGASVALVVGFVGTFVLTQGQHVSADSRPNGAALAGSAATPSASTSHGSAKPSPSRSKLKPSPSHRPRHRHQPPQRLPLVTTNKVFVGVVVNGGIVSGVRSFSSASGAHVAMVEIYTPFGRPFPAVPLSQVASTGATPLVQWNPSASSVIKAAGGGYSTYLRSYAASFKRFGHPVVLSFGHEMNGSWTSWGAGHVRPSTFVAAWRHIHNVFASAGVHNVSWSWDPSHVGDLPGPWWPGTRYVDKIGIDGYLRPGDTFAKIFADRLAYIRTFASKPIYIAETGVAPSSDQARQIFALFNGVQQYHLSGFVWFDINRLEDWRLEGRTAAVRAFRSAVAQMNG